MKLQLSREEASSSRWIVSFCAHNFQGLKVGSQVCVPAKRDEGEPYKLKNKQESHC